jgi:hypothetical protein
VKAAKQEEMLVEMSATMDRNLKKMREEIKSDQPEMRSILDPCLMGVKDGRKETTACQEATKTEPNTGMMQPIQEHQEIPTEKPQ